MKNKIKSLLLFSMLALCCCANNWESEETSEVVVQNSIIYEQDMPQAGASAILSKETPDELIKIAKLESQIAQLEEDKQLLEQENNQLIKENQELKELGTLTKAEWNLFYKVVRAEAGANSKQAQKNVAYVILNRIKSGKFPNTLTEVIYQKSQFSCVSNGAINRVELSDKLKENVREAYLDYKPGKSAQGALFFTKGTFSRTHLFEDEVGHNFYR